MFKFLLSIFRLLCAGLFVFAATLGTVGLIGAHYPNDKLPWWTAPACILTMLASFFLVMFAFNMRGFRPQLLRRALGERIAELDKDGLITREAFKATRAFALEEVEDEGSHYFIELIDGKVLYLNGQYLYEFEPTTDDPELNQARRFPCTDFVILRHKIAKYVIDIQCNGTVLEPELTAPPFTKADFKRGIPEDREVISSANYDELRLARSQVDA
jgi:hypothetical protein